MTAPIPVDDPQDPRIADYIELRDPHRRVVVERTEQFFVGEGVNVVRRMIAIGSDLRSVLLTPPLLEQLGADLHGVGAPVYVAPRDVLRATVGFDLHRGVVAAANRPADPGLDALLAAPTTHTVLALERVNDHENLGSIFRSAAGLGVDAVVLCPQCSDPLYRRCVRVSMGHVLTVPWTVTPPWPGALDTLRAAGFTTLALTPDGDTTIRDRTRRPGERIAILLGAEGPGLTETALDAADERVRIPMKPGADSLNVAVAAAIAAYALT
ncbi:MAG TPA: RNA methyltransferase [Acidimicrobiia bacterium]